MAIESSHSMAARLRSAAVSLEKGAPKGRPISPAIKDPQRLLEYKVRVLKYTHGPDRDNVIEALRAYNLAGGNVGSLVKDLGI